MNTLTLSNPMSQLDQIFNALPANSKATYKKAINQFLDFFHIGINQAYSITPADITTYIKHLKDIYANSTINVKLASLKTLYKKLSVLYKIPNPFEALKKMKVKTCFKTKRSVSREKVLKEEEIKKLLSYLLENPTFINTRNYCLIRLLCETGLRISEALSIQADSIKKSNNGCYIVKVIGKGHKEREVYILQDLYSKIKSISNGDYIFKSICGNQLKRTAIYKTIKRLGKKIIDKKISAHSFRHTFITAMIEKYPEKIKAISSYAGHSSASITLNMYLHNEITFTDIQFLYRRE